MCNVYLCDGHAGVWQVMFPVVACTEETTNCCMHCVLLWNEWEELHGHMACPSSFDKCRSVNQFIEPLIAFLWYKETVVWTCMQWAFFSFTGTLCNGNKILCELHYSWHLPLTFLDLKAPSVYYLLVLSTVLYNAMCTMEWFNCASDTGVSPYHHHITWTWLHCSTVVH